MEEEQMEDDDNVQIEDEQSEEVMVEPVADQNLDDKTKKILESKMPEKDKKDYLVRLGVIEKEKQSGVPFKIWAKVRKIPKHLHEAMMVHPKAKGLRVAELKQWDDIFKDF